MKIININCLVVNMNMNQMILQQNLQFERKMNSINTTNNLLDQLQNKLNSFFSNKHSKQIDKHFMSEEEGLIEEEDDKSQKNNFKLYDYEQENESKVYEPELPRFSENVEKKNDQFKLFPKNSGARRNPSQEQPLKNQAFHQQMQKNKQIDEFTWNKRIQKNNGQSHTVPVQKNQHTNIMIKELESLQHLMSQKLKSKQSQIAQLQQQIMTQNEERVYLYKVNVRLEEELQMISNMQNRKVQNNDWEVDKLERQIMKLKQEIGNKKQEKKQLKKQEQTLKEGYKTILKNRKDYIRKDLESRMMCESQTSENNKVLKGLLTELDKLKGAVESRIKHGSRKKINLSKS